MKAWLRSRILYLLHRREYKLISNFFDSQDYLDNRPELKNVDPILHFLTVGVNLGYRPRPDFDPDFYLDRYVAVRRAGVNPFVHYLEFGRNEGRIPFQVNETDEYMIVSKEFDRKFYNFEYSDAPNSTLDPVANYLH